MAFQTDAPIIQKTYDFYKELYLIVEKMPKKDKYALGQRLDVTTLNLLEILIAASSTKKEKIVWLNKASIKLDLLKILVRLCFEIKTIDQKKYLKLEEILQEIGKMLGGWIRSTKAPY